MAEQRGPLGLLDMFRRDVERVTTLLRPPLANPKAAPASAPGQAEPMIPPVQPEFNGDMTALLERKREEWLAAGIRPGVVRMGLDQAVAGAEGMARRMELFAREVDKPAVMRDYIENVADAWVRAMSNDTAHGA